MFPPLIYLKIIHQQCQFPSQHSHCEVICLCSQSFCLPGSSCSGLSWLPPRPAPQPSTWRFFPPPTQGFLCLVWDGCPFPGSHSLIFLDLGKTSASRFPRKVEGIVHFLRLECLKYVSSILTLTSVTGVINMVYFWCHPRSFIIFPLISFPHFESHFSKIESRMCSFAVWVGEEGM